MISYSRRRFLQLGTAGFAATLAGCSGVESELKAANDERVEWSTQVGVPISLSMMDGMLVVATNESIAGLDPTDGEIRWQTPLPKEEGRICYGPPVVVEDSAIYISGCRGTFAFDDTGNQRWQSDEPTGVMGLTTIGDRVYPNGGGEIYTVSESDGEVVSVVNLTQQVGKKFTGPGVGPEQFYFSTWDTSERQAGLAAVDPATVELQWELDLDSPELGHAPTYDDGMLYVASADSERGAFDINSLYAVDAGSQTIEWEIPTRAVYSSPVATSDRIVFAAADGDVSYVRSVRRSSGDAEWTKPFENLINPIDMLQVLDGTIHALLDDNEIVALDSTDGSERWRFSKEGHVDALPIVYDDFVIVATGDRVWALDSDALE